MTDITQRAGVTYVAGENQTWIGPSGVPGKNNPEMQTVTLDRSTFATSHATPYGAGYLPSGICLGIVTATGLYVAYTDAGTHGAGSDVALGFLGTTTPIDPNSTGELVVPMYWSGQVVVANLPTGHGLTTAARTDLAGHIRFI